MIANPKFLLSPQEYLEWEERQEIRYEYADGKVYAMTDTTLPHSAIAVNFASLLKNYLRGRGFRILTSNAKVGREEKRVFLYPDIHVTCDPSDRTAVKFAQYPCLIAEVLSPLTEAHDRGSKFSQYRRFESLKEYVLISSDSISVEVFRLNEKGKWELTPYVEGDEIELTSIDLKFSIELLYEDITLVPEAIEKTEE